MNLKELRQRTAQESGLAAAAADNEFLLLVDNLINDSQNELGQRLRIPQVYSYYTGVIGNIALPADCLQDGVISIKNAASEVPLEITGYQEMEQFEPAWNLQSISTDVPTKAIIDPLNITGGIVFSPPSTKAQDWALLYIAKPNPLTDEASEPWTVTLPNGTVTASQAKNYHFLIAFQAAIKWLEYYARNPKRSQEEWRQAMSSIDRVQKKLDAEEAKIFNLISGQAFNVHNPFVRSIGYGND